ncbi:MAG TPA: hypothetical protein VMV77_11310 [Bacteroidales bacterium]|nr:hypothetical protein [Bacteroidales bacterium]
MRIKPLSFNLFLLINGILCITFILVFKPVIQGDASAYINLAKQIFHIPGASLFDLSHRSPLYSLLLGLVMLIFGETNFIFPVMILQYLLVFITAIYVYRIFIILIANDKIAFFAGLFGIINLSTIAFAYNILSEILSLFIFTMLVHKVLMYYSNGRRRNIFLAGLLSGLMVLARFNALGVPLILLALVIIIHLSHEGFHKFRILFPGVAIVTISSLLVLNLWALYNYQSRGFYNIFPMQIAGQRWAIPATINENNVVTDENKEVLQIFLNAKAKLAEQDTSRGIRKASLLNIPVIRKADDFFKPPANGFFLYSLAEPGLLSYFNLSYSSKNINILGEKLKPFYKEIAIQNRHELLKLKIFSFLYTFKYVSPTLPADMSMNLNMLPDLIIKLYKFLFLFISVTVFAVSLFHSLIIILRNEIAKSYKLIILYAFIWYFPVINFYANVLNDANRFKFPAESLILGLGVYYVSAAYLYLERKISNKKVNVI